MTAHDILLMALLLFAAHALADFPLQGDFLSRAKSHKTAIPGVDPDYALLCHAAIHGALVALVTANVWIGFAELVLHGTIDRLKSGRHIGFFTDQYLHLMCKVVWIAIVYSLETA